MVSTYANLMGNGLKDWIVQRLTAIYLAGYSLFLFGFILLHSPMQFERWQSLFHCVGFKLASMMALLALSLHAWIGVWTVTTDYLKCSLIRLSIQTGVITWLLAQFIWGLLIMWGQ